MITIYQLYCKNPEIKDFYIGSTRDYEERKKYHKNRCNNKNEKCHNIKVYQFIRENGGFNDWDFKVLNQIEYYNDNMKRRQEQCYIDLMKPTLNTINAFLSEDGLIELRKKCNKKIYSEKRKEIREQQNEYYEKNKEKINIRKKEYYQENLEKIREKDRERNKIRYENNKKYLKNKRKEYREKNKEEYNKKRRLKYMEETHKKQMLKLLDFLDVE